MSAATLKIAAVAIPVAATILGKLIEALIMRARKARRNPPRAPPGISLEDMIERARKSLGMVVIDFLNFGFCVPQGSGKRFSFRL